MSNRIFDDSALLKRRQNQTYAYNLYLNKMQNKLIINNPQNSNGDASVFSEYKPGAETQYYKDLLAGHETISLGGIAPILSIQETLTNNSSPVPVVTDPVVPDPVVPDPVVPDPVVPDPVVITAISDNLTSEYLPNVGTNTIWNNFTETNNATMTGTNAPNSQGYTFNGTTTQYGRIASSNGVNNFTNTDNYTVEVWFNPSQEQPSGTLATVLEKWNSTDQLRYPYVFRYAETANRIQVAVFDGTNNPTAFITGVNTNTWVQIVGVFDFTNKSLTIYKNGISDVNINGNGVTVSLVGVGTISNTSQVAIAHRIHRTTQAPEFMFKGSIGLIRIYNTALSSSQILTNFNANKNTFGL